MLLFGTHMSRSNVPNTLLLGHFPPICNPIYPPACPGPLPYTARHSCCSIVPGAVTDSVSGKCGCSCCAMDLHACQRNARALQLPSPVAPVMKCWARTGPVSESALRRFQGLRQQLPAAGRMRKRLCLAALVAPLARSRSLRSVAALPVAGSVRAVLRTSEVCWLSAPVASSSRVRRLVTLHLHTCKRSAAHPTYVKSAAC